MFAVDLVKVDRALRGALHEAGSDQPLSFLRLALFCCVRPPQGRYHSSNGREVSDQ
jgi:hypothetical protein